MRVSLRLTAVVLLLASLTACAAPADAVAATTPCKDCVIKSARVVGEYTSLPYPGDLWASTWAADGNLYTAFGDATGMNACLPTLLPDEPDEFDTSYVEVRSGCYRTTDTSSEYCEIFDCARCYPLCPYTAAGVLRLSGPVPRFDACRGRDQCVVSRHVPYGDYRVFDNSDKPSSLIAIGKRLYAQMHYPPGAPTRGYLAYSDNDGKSWRRLRRSPWGRKSNFRVMMFINMGRAYRLNQDGYLYALGIGEELADKVQRVYLARVSIKRQRRGGRTTDPVLRYDRYEYLAGLDDAGDPLWSGSQKRAMPLDGLRTQAQGSAIYHKGIGRFLFLSGYVGTAPGTEVGLKSDDSVPVGALYEAPDPWGPWHRVALIPGGFIASLIPKGAGDDSVYFTAAGGGGVTYNLNIGRIEMQVRRRPRVPPARFRLVWSRKVEQIIGDVDFETLAPTRQSTETRFGLAHADLGAPFVHRKKLWFLFGDADPEAPGWDPRHDDAIAFTRARTARQLSLSFLKDRRRPRGYRNPRVDCPDEGRRDCVDLGTLNVPVAGLSDGRSMFVWFTTDAAGRSLVARSDNGGRRFKKVYDFGRTHFINIAAAYARGPIPGLPASRRGRWVLIFGSGDHDHNDVYLAATSLRSLRRGERGAVRFLAAVRRRQDGRLSLSWSRRERDSVPIFRIEHGKGPGPEERALHAWGFGEPLIHYSPRLGLWIATYNAGTRRTIRLRTAERPWGPWSRSIVLFDPERDYGRGPARGRFIGDGRNPLLGGEGELYGPYVIDRFTRRQRDGRVRLFWLLSTWQPYTVVLMKSILEPRRPTASAAIEPP